MEIYQMRLIENNKIIRNFGKMIYSYLIDIGNKI